jgi:hypothetical protein
MMNMIELQNKLKNFSQEQLVGMMQQPSGDAPQFMVLGEITRRQKMQQEATKAPTQSVAQEAVSAAGVPQGGIADMARTLAPQTNVAQNTGAMSAPPQGMPSAPQGIARMASGGVIKMQAAGKVGFVPMEQLGKLLTAYPGDRPKRKLIATVPVGRSGDLVNVYDDYTFINVDENGNEGWLVTSPTESNAVFEALGIPAEERFVKRYDRFENHTGYTPLEGYVPPEQRTAAAAESAPTGLGAYAAPTMDAPVSDSAPSTPVFDATVDAPIAPQMPVPPKTDSMPQGPRPSTTGGTQVNIAGNIYAVLDDGSVIDQTGRTPPPPVAELARTKAVSMAREPASSLNQAPAADAAIYGGGVADGVTYDSAAPSGLAALSPDTMPTVDGPFAYPESRFSTNLGPRAMLDWEEGQAEEAALIDARTNADLGSGRTPRYDTAIGPQPTSKVDSSGMDLVSMLRAQEDARTPRYDTAIGPQPAPAQSYASTGQQGDFREPRYAPFTAASRMQAQLDEEARIAALPNRGSGNLYSVPDMRLAMDPYSGEFLQVPTLGSQAERAVKTGLGTLDATRDVISNIPSNVATLSGSIASATGAKSSAYSTLSKAELNALASGTLSPADAAALEAERLTSTPTPTSTAASVPLEKSVLAAELTDAMKPKPRPEDLFAPTTDNALGGGGSGTGTGSGTGSGSGSGSGGSSNYETKLLEMLSRQEANAKSDKWMALAQAGMSLMQGGTGSFGGDLGRAGQTGLAALQGSRASNDKSQLDILGAIENSKLKREAIAASAAKSTAPNAAALKSVIENLDIEMAPLAARAATGKLTPDEKTQLDELKKQRNYYVNILGGLAGGGNGAYPASPTPKPPYDATKPPGIIGRGINAVRDAITG